MGYMWRTCRIVAYINIWQCGLLPPSPHHLYLTFLPLLSLPNLPTHHCPFPIPPQQTPVCDAPLSVSMCSHCSTLTYEWEHAVFDFLFLCQFAVNDGFQVHPCSFKVRCSIEVAQLKYQIILKNINIKEDK